MSEEKGSVVVSLEELNQAFFVKVEQKRKQKQHKRILLLAGAVLSVAVLTIAVTLGVQLKAQPARESAGSSDETTQESVLSAKEQQKWNEIKTDTTGKKVYIILNKEITVKGRNAGIRLINPIYSALDLQIKIVERGNEGNVLYQSERLAPGTILEEARLNQEIAAKNLKAVVIYTVYNVEKVNLGEHRVEVLLKNKNT